ncbi:MAG: polyprenyl synthetase family protein [Acidimicrobiales bacterium]
MSAPRGANEILERSRELVAPALHRAVAALTDEVRPIAEYHFGWRDADGHLVEHDGGKGVRPALAVLSAEAVGASAEFGIPGAVAVELVHNFSLIHDDVVDHDEERRHRPSVWALYGIGKAVIVGDALLALAEQSILDSQRVLGVGAAAREAAVARAARRIVDATSKMIAGQALDMDFEHTDFVGLDACREMEAGKTGALLSCASAIGAEFAGAGAELVAALARFGLELGLAFQAIDDVLGIWGDPQATGKPAGSDLRSAKKSLPVVAALARGGPEADELSALLRRGDLDDEATARAAALVEKSGGRQLALDEAARRLDQAIDAIALDAITDRARDELTELARFVVEREF